MNRLEITAPDDWHIHLRDGAFLARTVNDAARVFKRAIVMPNLSTPVTTVQAALDYQSRILAELVSPGFKPLMTLYLTDQTSVGEIRAAKQSGAIFGCKLYPAGATTNSQAGVTDINKISEVLGVMAEIGMPLLIHGEVTDQRVDIFDREKVFIDLILQPLIKRIPKLMVVFEHITTKEAVDFVLQSSPNIAATITAHHLLLNRNDMLAGGFRPHAYCLPVLKRENHRLALLAAATSGNPKFFLGTDSAPHARSKKESACGCAGVYTAFAAMELYTEAFDSVNALDKLEAFASFFGADFYQLPRNQGRIILEKKSWQVPTTIAFGREDLVPMRAGESLHWVIKSN